MIGRAPSALVKNCRRLPGTSSFRSVSKARTMPFTSAFSIAKAAQKRRCSPAASSQAPPPGVGNTAYCTAAKDVRGLEELTQSFLERVDFVGFGSIEYKWDPASERFVIIEPT